MTILLLNGPNLNLLGTREPEIYGTTSMEAFLEDLRRKNADVHLLYFQSNHEGALLDRIQQADYDGLIINPGAYTHYSLALADGLRTVSVPIVEIHISNIYAREDFRQKSVTAPWTSGVISGLGLRGYSLALHYLRDILPTGKE